MSNPGLTQFLAGTIKAGKSTQIINSTAAWCWVTVIRITSGSVTISGADNNPNGMPIGSTPITLPVSPGSALYAFSTTDDTIGYSICPMPPGLTESATLLISALQKILAPQTIPVVKKSTKDLNDELNNINRRGF